jgi:chromosome segregation protein
MYLKEIIASGFKSFADKINIKLDNDITCIVGPNGSGKSNVVDAVRWVLGEQRVKSLRGSSSMQDVIFSGTKKRNPLNVASVELIFDNSDHYINVPYTEISVKRRIYRSGENEYFINNEKCRLKDITDLFLDSGVGKQSFNIISQGEVDQIISNSSQDRRIIIEEAAGVLKYKKRKEEALRKLERTHINIDRVNDIITELETRLGPLKEQSEKAKIYLENKEGLDKYEVALIAYDITNYSNVLNDSKERLIKLEDELVNISSVNNKDSVDLISKNNELDSLQNEYNELQKDLVEVTEKVENLNGKINLLKEQKSNNKEKDELNERLKSVINNKSKLEGDIKVLKENISNKTENIKSLEENFNKLDKDLMRVKNERVVLSNDYKNHDKDIISLNHKIESLKLEISDGGVMPNSVREVLNNNELSGILTTISNVIDTEEKYMNALSIASHSNKNFIITTNEESANNAVRFLKDNHLGRATFFPLTVIKERTIDSNSMSKIQNNPSFLGVLSDVIKYNKKYDSIIKNQFGNIILTDTIENANELSRLVDNKYRVITLDGDQVNVGGSITGGSLNTTRTVITAKQDLTNSTRKLEVLIEEKNKVEKSIQNLDKEKDSLEDNIFKLYKEKASLTEELNELNKKLNELEKSLSEEETNLSNLESINNNKVEDKELKLIEEYNKELSEKEKIELNINNLSNKISNLKDEIERLDANTKEKNSTIKSLEKSKTNLEIEINKVDIKLENLLDILREDYEITYERAKSKYSLDIDPEEARKKIRTYKNKIKEIGMVNTDSIAEYEEVNSRYTHLTTQKEDLLQAEDTLLEIMNEMDEVMKEEFATTFTNINVEFQKVFKELFKGGNASLELTNPEDMLETGVDILAQPPGKKVTTISLLSGGEKTLTAISLLFAILNVKKVPFCLFDEVEAALDEANVVEFGNYLDHYKDRTEFLIITHKKKTMEYAKVLYGITMQESGVSKLVSVKLVN